MIILIYHRCSLCFKSNNTALWLSLSYFNTDSHYHIDEKQKSDKMNFFLSFCSTGLSEKKYSTPKEMVHGPLFLPPVTPITRDM